MKPTHANDNKNTTVKEILELIEKKRYEFVERLKTANIIPLSNEEKSIIKNGLNGLNKIENKLMKSIFNLKKSNQITVCKEKLQAFQNLQTPFQPN